MKANQADGWTTKTLSDLATINMGQSPDSTTYNELGIGLPFLQGCGDFGKNHPETNSYCSSPSKQSKVGNILISVRAPVGDMNTSDKEYCIGRGLAAIAGTHVESSYLRYSIEQHIAWLKRRGQGSTFEAIGSRDLNGFPVPIPKSSEVRNKITSILTTVDNLIDQTQNLIDKYTAVKQGMMADLFSRGIDLTGTPETNKNYGQLRPNYEEAPDLYQETEFGWIPKDWSLRTVDEVADVTKLAGFEFTLHFNYVERGEIIALRALNIKNEKIDLTNIQRIYKRVSDKLPRSKLYIGDIVFTYIGAYIGDAVIIDENDKYHLAPNICLIRPNQKKSAFFLFKQLRNETLYRQMMSKTVTTATPSLTMTQIRTLKLVWPELTEQIAIEARLKSTDKQLDNLSIELKKYQKIKKGLMQDLLTGKVKVD
ncbi:restriction endonuclease subunit S [Pseudoalteromonas sp. MM17-2]|uniref:restriction endonuclease subunit S n=1 Tax=Pseudoalteromonas sp. MM17-2 TaxID=2917753 RepID=UPI001EF66352|nr:restriction endonuclease subunit S [Pseudoalteromonas sp. MM17-2]MCG7543537.1 restriction endonuclease subunit S [Pseudoalteromonas sp. MM17-2]